MTEKRMYENVMLFQARIFNMKNLWTPSTEYKGQPTTKPNYLVGVIVNKTRGHWSEEPVFANMWAAMQKIHAAKMANFPYGNVDWPIKDGDMPEPGRAASEWAKGHWMLSGSSGDVIKTEIVQNGNIVPLANRAGGVKPGDVVSLGGAVAQKANDPRGIKLYVNSVLFCAAGEEIAVGNSVSGAELMAEAQRQGLQVAGFNGAPAGGGFGQAPQGGGFAPQSHGGFAQPQAGGFGQPNPGFTQGGAAPAQTGGFAAPGTAQNGPGFGGNAASPFNQPGHNPNGQAFGNAPANPFGPR